MAWRCRVACRYDLSLDLSRLDPELRRHAEGMRNFTWSDFALCRWPSRWVESGHDTLTGSYPTGVAAALARLNQPIVEHVNQQLRQGRGDAVFSFSHFLPRAETLPDWLEPSTEVFAHSWLEHPAGSTAVKFSRVAGSDRIDAQLRALTAGVVRAGKRAPRHMHAFGHSHRPKDFSLEHVRYVSFPLGYGKEREKRLVPDGTQNPRLMWEEAGPCRAPVRPLVRFWEEHGGAEPNLDKLLAGYDTDGRASSVADGSRAAPCTGAMVEVLADMHGTGGISTDAAQRADDMIDTVLVKSHLPLSPSSGATDVSDAPSDAPDSAPSSSPPPSPPSESQCPSDWELAPPAAELPPSTAMPSSSTAKRVLTDYAHLHGTQRSDSAATHAPAAALPTTVNRASRGPMLVRRSTLHVRSGSSSAA